MLHDAESELYQKLLVADGFLGMFLIGDISLRKYAKTVKKILFRVYNIRPISWYVSLRPTLQFNFCCF